MPIGIPRAQRERLRDQRAFERALVGEQTLGIVEAQMGSPIYDPQLAAPLVIPPQHALAVRARRCVGIVPLQSHPARTDASALPQWTAANFRGFFYLWPGVRMLGRRQTYTVSQRTPAHTLRTRAPFVIRLLSRFL